MRMTHYLKGVMAFFLLFQLGNNLLGQGFRVSNFTAEDGLPSSEVYDVIQDKYGYIWLCTDKGLSRYNGYEFTNYDQNNGLPDNVVFNFFEGENGEIWCSTRSLELFKITGENPQFTLYPYNHLLKNFSNKDPIVTLKQLEDGALLIKLKNRVGFIHISNRGELLNQPFHVDVKTRKLFLHVLNTDGTNRSFFFEDTSNLYARYFALEHYWKLPVPVENIRHGAVSFSDRAVYADGSKIYIHTDSVYTLQQSNSEKTALIIQKLTEDYFWVSYLNGGVQLFSKSGKLINHYLPNESVTKFYIDKDDNIWITTLFSGVYLLRNPSVKYFESSRDKRVSSLTPTPNHGLLIGYVNGDIDQLSNDGRLTTFYEGAERGKAVSAYDSVSGNTFYTSGILYGTKQGYICRGASNYLIPDGDRILFGNSSVIALNYKDTADFSILFPNRKIHDVVRWTNRIYAGGIEGLLYVEKKNEAKVLSTVVRVRVDDLNRISNYLVVGTNGSGIIFLNRNNEVVLHLTKADGLKSNFVNHTYTENDSTLWIATNNGINRLVYERDQGIQIDYMDVTDGLLSNEVWNTVVQNGNLYVGTQKGINYLTISAFDQLQKVDPNYFFTWNGIYLNDQPIGTDLNGDFKYWENTIEFRFESILYDKEKEFHYRYKLEGHDEKWTNTKERNVRYAELTPGAYTMIVQAINRRGDKNKNELIYSFVIAPPFWSTWWFLAVVLAAVIFIIYAFFKFQILRYNADIVREILRLLMKRLRKEQAFILVKDKGEQVKVYTATVHFIKTNGNYLELHTENKVYLTRSSIKQFMEEVSDPMEFLQVHRSYLVRIDKVVGRSSKALIVLNEKIPIGRKYASESRLIQLAI